MNERERLTAYFASEEFHRRCAETLARQDAGEDFTLEQLATSLGVPVWLAQIGLLETARRFAARLIVPDIERPQ